MSLFHSLGQLLTRNPQTNKANSRRRKRTQHGKRRMLFEGLEERAMLALVNFTESTDLSGVTPTAFTIDTAGVNRWAGTLLTPTDGQDAIAVTVAPGLEITSVRFRYEDTFQAGFQNQNRDQGIVLNANGGGTFSHSFDVPNNQGGLVVDVTNPQFTVPATLPFSGTTNIFISAGTAFPAAPWLLEFTATAVAVSTNPSITATTANPDPVQAGNSTLLTVTTSPGTGPASTGLAVSGDLSSIGGSASQTFFDNGTNGDVTSGDGIFSFSATVSAGTTAGVKSLPVTILDAQGRVDNNFIFLNVTAPPLPTLSINDRTLAEGNSGTTSFTFTVTQSAISALTTTVNFATVGVTATAGSDYTATSGLLTFAPGETTKTVTVLVTGDTVFEADQTFTVTLFSTTNATIATGTGTGSITNDDAAPTLSIDSPAAPESAGTLTFTVTRTGATELPISVIYSTNDGTARSIASATPGTPDFTITADTLNFAASLAPTTTQSFTVTLTNDGVNEATEQFTASLSGPTNATIATGTGTATITNDDQVPTVSMGIATADEGNSSTTSFNFTVTLSAASGQTITVDYTTADNTALAGSDYTATSGTLTFVPGETMKTVTVPVIGDTVFEANETFTLSITSGTNVSPGALDGTGTITNDDSASTTTTVVASVNPAVFGQSVTLTATVSSLGGPTPTGTMTFFDGVTLLGTAILSGGTASISTNTLAVGPHTITATYSGDSQSLTSTGSSLITVNKANTTTVVVPSIPSPVFGQNVTFTATVGSVSPGSGTPTGTVQFIVDGNPLSSTTLNGSGQAVISTSTLAVGSHTITALYLGSSDFNISASGTSSITVSAAPTVTSPTATNIGVTTATLGGNVTTSNFSTITERGIVWSITTTNNNPQINARV